MLNRAVLPVTFCIAGLVWAGLSGCDTLHKAGVPGMERYLKQDPVEIENERRQRERFSNDRDHKALFWLLANRIETGMMLSEVEQVLGTPGESTSDPSYLKSDGIHQTTDSAYIWGPDTSGKSVVLFFRDGHLANFNRKDYRDPTD